MKRRDFVSSAASAGVAGMLPKHLRAGAEPEVAVPSVPGPQPNILIIIVDQMRYPSVFPSGINDVDAFLSRIMPNVHTLWRQGVKFTNHFTAAVACTPSRGTLLTGLYSHQTWLLETILDRPYNATSKQPWLDPSFPTYGKLLRQAGYQTPYIGKWHVSIPPRLPPRLDEYGFQGLTYYDPTGFSLQGTVGDHAHGFLNDQDIADQAKSWLGNASAANTPWCLTVSFVNPHDKQDFWAGTEFRTYNTLFNNQDTYLAKRYHSMNDGQEYPPVVSWDADPLKAPPSYGYPAVPPNWETAQQITANKPSTQALFRLDHESSSGGASDDPNQAGFVIDPFPLSNFGIAKAPYTYWQRALDCYTELMSIVDERIGEVLAAVPAAQADNTLIVFTSDHGDFAGAHGFLSGKTGTLYDEAYHVPLIVADPGHRFTGGIDELRTGFTSSVDVLPLVVSLGYNGSSGWQTADLAEIYGNRHNLISMLKAAEAPGRDYVLFTADEPRTSTHPPAPTHLLGLRTRDYKIGTYADWNPGATTVFRPSLETEFYDYQTPGGRAEVSNTPDDPDVEQILAHLLDTVIPNELARNSHTG